MESNRRTFLKLSGLCALGAGAKPIIDVIAATDKGAASPSSNALTAKRWAMVVDTTKCKRDCTDCIQACHGVHNVPDWGNPKDEVKWIWREQYAHAFPSQEHEHLPPDVKNKPFVVLCNHCDNPPCVRVCPVKATWKRKQDGIVVMDYHRCVGCRYCIAACPYGSRSFNWRAPRKRLQKTDPVFPTRTKGVTEKCNFCMERLAKGLPPACVDACKHGALIFGDLDDPISTVRIALSQSHTIRRKPELGTRPQVYYIL